MTALQMYVAGAARVVADVRTGKALVGLDRAHRYRVARIAIRWARCAKRAGRLLTPDEKERIISDDLQPYEFCP